MLRSTVVGLFVCVALAVFANAEDDEQVFGKRADDNEYSTWDEKRNGAPQPFVRFGRSGRVDHMHDILSTLQRLQLANE
ncbi:FMRFamide-like neuropeptide 11 [Toxocara canis]|uniref:FMRFamide-like neuropeptide 11 n=1 Tax=Toxocara canis TaxID=6265 RepID=A0A0B2V3L0_TOXCA|nr:FMRFamide-like neuropeptide 11 [Toxocara canis]